VGGKVPGGGRKTREGSKTTATFPGGCKRPRIARDSQGLGWAEFIGAARRVPLEKAETLGGWGGGVDVSERSYLQSGNGKWSV